MYSAPTINRLLKNMYPAGVDPAVVSRERFGVVVAHVVENIHPSPWRARLDLAALIAAIALVGGVVVLACIYS